MKIEGVRIMAGGKKRLFRYQYKAMKATCSDLGVEAIEDLPSVSAKPSFDAIESIMYHGFKAGADYDKEEVDFERSGIADWVDEDMQLFPTLLKEVTAQLKQTLGGPDDGKKKQAATGKGKRPQPKK